MSNLKFKEMKNFNPINAGNSVLMAAAEDATGGGAAPVVVAAKQAPTVADVLGSLSIRSAERSNPSSVMPFKIIRISDSVARKRLDPTTGEDIIIPADPNRKVLYCKIADGAGGEKDLTTSAFVNQFTNGVVPTVTPKNPLECDVEFYINDAGYVNIVALYNEPTLNSEVNDKLQLAAKLGLVISM